MSNQAGQSNLRRRLAEAGIEVEDNNPALAEILQKIKAREDEGYSYDTAQASFELLARETLGIMPRFFEVKRYRVTVERRKNKYNRMVSLSEAVVVVKIGEDKMLSVSESMDEQGPTGAGERAGQGAGQGPRALSRATSTTSGWWISRCASRRAGPRPSPASSSTARTAQGRRWATVGVSANIVDASFEALLDAIEWKLVRDGAPAA
jgi:2-isopropylmalate synthase